MHREPWLQQVDELFDIENYLRNFFNVDAKLDTADREIHTFDASSNVKSTCFATLDAARSWWKRVNTWGENLRRDLRADSVPAPGLAGRRWLLFPSESLQIDDHTGEIRCLLCRKCAASLSSLDEQKPKTKMPMQARANGLWHGPQPDELADLSYAEAKVINLARMYVSVKRVFLDRSSYARTNAAEAPMYRRIANRGLAGSPGVLCCFLCKIKWFWI